VVLDGSGVPFPANPQGQNMGFVSNVLSGEDKTFGEDVPIALELVSQGQYTSQGFTLTFDTEQNTFPTAMTISWYRGETLLDKREFFPDAPVYFCQNKVENYNRVIFEFWSLNMPLTRLRLRSIDYGYGTVFRGADLRSVKLIQELDPISTEISINTVDFTLDSHTNIDYSFQTRQPLTVYHNGQLMATTFVKSSKRKGERLWDVHGEDYIGLLDSIPFAGGIYQDKSSVELLSEIATVAKVPLDIAEDVVNANEAVSGYIPYTNCREALMQVAFAIQAVVDTSYSEAIKVYKLTDDVKQAIPLERIMTGQSFADDETITGVEVAMHNYTPITERMEAYSAEGGDVGENVFVKFSEPLHDLQITNGTIVSYGTNYAVISASAGCVLTGAKYEHNTTTRRMNNPVVLASEIEKVLAIDNGTLVGVGNIDKVLQKCYDWLVKVNSVNLKISEKKHLSSPQIFTYGSAVYGEAKYGGLLPRTVSYDDPVFVGDAIKAETEYLGSVQGRVIRLSFSLGNGSVVKEAVLK
jgi:hypothetical protein